MFSIIKSLGGLLWKNVDKEDVKDEETILENCLEQLDKGEECLTLENEDTSSARYFTSTGIITDVTDTYGIIDKLYNFSIDEKNCKVQVDDKVHYIAYRVNQKHIKIIEITDVETRKKRSSNVTEKIITGKVMQRAGREVIMDHQNMRFSLDSVVSNFLPVKGDWLELLVEEDIRDDDNFNPEEVLNIKSIKSTRSKTVCGVVTRWDGELGIGIIDKTISFTKYTCENMVDVSEGDKVAADVIESDQGELCWRAITVASLSQSKRVKERTSTPRNGIRSDYGITLPDAIDFGTVLFEEKKDLEIEITNTGSVPQTLVQASFLDRRNDCQFRITQGYCGNYTIQPGAKAMFTFHCTAKFMGYSEQVFSFKFQSFCIKRLLKVYIIDKNWQEDFGIMQLHPSTDKNFKSMKSYQKWTQNKVVAGIKMFKPSPFIKVRLPYYSLPKNMWNILMTCQKLPNLDAGILKLHELVPCLAENGFNVYSSRFHALLYLEEIQCILKMEEFNMKNVFLSQSSCHEFLSLGVEKLSEKRPSILVGDIVNVTNPWLEGTVNEGFIHRVNADSIDIKFSHDFHTKYNGEELTVKFKFSRSSIAKAHQGIDLAMEHLGESILFPNHLKLKPPQINIDVESELLADNYATETKSDGFNKPVKISWITKLNVIQKRAVINVLLGVARPLPYVIFGPPGTGKTLTLVETILQIITLMPHSRIMVAVPSNSAADMISERLIDVGKLLPGQLVRLVANYIVTSGRVPEKLKSYCATLEVNALMNDFSSTYRVQDDGIKLNCSQKFGEIGRHRVTVGTCSCIGTLYKLGFPKGHFTHIIVDEAGQLTEPNLMVALAFADKASSQIVLAGDPLQLGPMVVSPFAQRSGLDESYLERLLTSFLYKKDFDGFGLKTGGYDPRLITRLEYNYRSLPKLLKLCSEMFYDNCLIPQINKDTEWVSGPLKRLSKMFSEDDSGIDGADLPGIVFHGVRGVNYRGEESPSWFNPHEAAMVLMFCCKLYSHGFTSDQIGIITPYLEQIRYLKKLFQDINMDIPKVGSVEEFQGQERKIILLSTVRSSEDLIAEDVKHFLGFLKNPKRLNVALTRAQVFMVIFGNPHLLCLDDLWFKVIKHIVAHSGYIGCDLPPCLQVSRNKDK